MDSESDYDASDNEELQEAFAQGLIKPGLNEVLEQEVKTYANHIGELKRHTHDMKLNLPWIETLDLLNEPAPLAPELAVQIKSQEDKRLNATKNNKKLPQFETADDPVINDFKREMLFHRQAQAAVLEGFAKLKQLGIPTIRPDDFFAEMAKTDEHMQKIRENLVKKQSEAERSERVKQLRAQKKIGKAVQKQAKVQKQTEKKEMLDQVKKFRKGMTNNLDFLNDKKGGNKGGPLSRSQKSLAREKKKNIKFGYGGKKKGSKLNTKDSAADVSDYKMPGKLQRGGKISRSQIGAKRLGKNRRQKAKQGRK